MLFTWLSLSTLRRRPISYDSQNARTFQPSVAARSKKNYMPKTTFDRRRDSFYASLRGGQSEINRRAAKQHLCAAQRWKKTTCWWRIKCVHQRLKSNVVVRRTFNLARKKNYNYISHCRLSDAALMCAWTLTIPSPHVAPEVNLTQSQLLFRIYVCNVYVFILRNLQDRRQVNVLRCIENRKPHIQI